jgi:4-hydroxymandelate oxidase
MSWLAGLEDRARLALPPAVFEYVATGARDGVSAGEAGWSSVRFQPRVLRDVTDVDLSVTLLGRPVLVPWGVAPTTLQRAVHPDGERAMARACAAAGSVLVVSSNAGTPFADIGGTGVRWWLQAYLPADRRLAEPMLRRAVDAGAEAVVLTADTPVVGTKYPRGDEVVWDLVDTDLLRVNFDPGYDDQPGAEKATDLGPDDVAQLGELTGLPVVVKGVLRAEDARRCVAAGARAVWVSNHGGRQLDRAATTRSCLSAVVAALDGGAEVYVDGGVRSGLVVLAALALGADAVFVGRLPVWALVEGELGVARLHADLREELADAFRLAGCRTAADTRGIASSPTAP